MSLSLRVPPSFAGALDLLPPVPGRSTQVATAQPAPMRPMRPPASMAPTGADARVDEVLRAYRRTGGLVRGDEFARLLRRRTSQPISLLGRWIVERRMLSFGWQGEHLLPMFQFEPDDLEVRRPVSAVLDEFDCAFDDWDRASWFALPNAWLGGDAPLDVLGWDPDAVLQAARADRFIVRGR
jgi:hypothetical protein